MNTRIFFLVISPLMLLAAALGFAVAEARARPPEPTIFWPDDVVAEMRSLVEETYVDEISQDQAREMFYAACKAYLAGLDPYCEFYTPEERRALEEETHGEFGGVGILGWTRPEGIIVRGARVDDPAWIAGIRAGDRIVAVDGVDIEADPGAAILPRLRGEPGSSVSVAWIPAGGGARREAVVTRSQITIDSVVGCEMLDAENGVGYVRLSRFQDNTSRDLRTAIVRLRESGATSFVLDLRSNYGGVLPAAVACADQFLSEGVVVVTRDRQGLRRPNHVAVADPEDLLDEPLVVLVDGSTASAAEILAGALQDRRRGVLVGERTYGKFLVQRIVPLDRDQGAVRLTTARYYTPFGRNLQRDDSRNVRGGLVPDEPLAPSDGQRELVQRWLDDQVGLNWDLLPLEGDDAVRPVDPVLDRALGMLRDAHAVEMSLRK